MASQDYLFAPEILDIDLDQSDAKFNPKLSIADPGEGLVVRPLAKQDYEKGFLQVLSIIWVCFYLLCFIYSFAIGWYAAVIRKCWTLLILHPQCIKKQD